MCFRLFRQFLKTQSFYYIASNKCYLNGGIYMESQKWFIDNLGYDRSVLRTCKKKSEFDIVGIHPRHIMRSLRKNLENVKDENDSYLFDIKADPIQISREDVGRSLGFVKGGLIAMHEHYEHELGNLNFKPFRNLGTNLLLIGGALALFFLAYDMKLFILSLPILYLGIIYRQVRAKTTFPMKTSDDVYCLIEGELNEDESQNVDSNISLIIAGVNYCDFWDKDGYTNYFKDNFKLASTSIVSKNIHPTLFSIGNFLSSKNYPDLIFNEIEAIKKDIFIQIYDKNRDIIKKNSKHSVLINNRKLKNMTSYEISQELSKYLESNFELGKFLNIIVLNQEINDIIITKKTIFPNIPEINKETNVEKIINDFDILFHK